MKRNKNNYVVDFLLSRRSDSARTLSAPVPDDSALFNILTAAARTPDHGKLVPWRFLVLKREVMEYVARRISEIGESRQLDLDKLKKNVNTYANAHLVVAVISSPQLDKNKIPLMEQQLSAGAVCLALLNAAQAQGWGANWLSGWMAHDKFFLGDVLGLSEVEFVAGFIHIGTTTIEPVERARPDISKLTSWLEV